MASISKVGSSYRASLYVKGIRETKSGFRTQREANAWAVARESELRDTKPLDRKTFKDALERYLEEEAPKRRGERSERLRIGRMLHTPHIDLRKPLGEITEADVAFYRDARSKVVQPASVLRELTTLAGIFEVARLEWKWITHNPVRDVRKPSKPRHRERIISGLEVRKMIRALQGTEDQRTVADAFLFALMTGMRAGEICGLTWEQDQGTYLSKVGTKTTWRDVPLSKTAQKLLARRSKDKRPFPISSASRDTLFRRHRDRIGLSGFTFHDARHTAATRIARKVDVLNLCKIFGWTNPKFALVYYNPTAAQIAGLL